jgi:hypothetical protein
MCDDKYILDFKTLESMKQDVYNTPVEKCAFLQKDDLRILTIDKNTITLGTSKKEGERAYCSYMKNVRGNYLYHSHPKESRSYPSSEDILKVLKSDKLMFSIIATRWGVYIIKPTDKSQFIAQSWNENKNKYYKEKIDRCLSKIGFMENDKGYKEQVYDDIYQDEEEVIHKNLKKITGITYLRLKFCSWNEMNV